MTWWRDMIDGVPVDDRKGACRNCGAMTHVRSLVCVCVWSVAVVVVVGGCVVARVFAAAPDALRGDTQTEKDCVERPRARGAWKTGTAIAADEILPGACALQQQRPRVAVPRAALT